MTGTTTSPPIGGKSGVEKTTVEITEEALPELFLAERTLSQDIAQRTGRSRDAARAALDMHGEDSKEAYKMLMSNLVLTVDDGLPCEVERETVRCGMAAWLDSDSSSSSPAAIVRLERRFSDCHLLRIQRGRSQDLRIFALEPVQIYLISRTRIAATPAPGWELLASTEPDVPGLILAEEGWTSAATYLRCFDPGTVIVPLQGADVVPLVRVLKKPSVKPPCNSLKAAPSSQQAGSAATCRGEASPARPLEALPSVPEDDEDDLEEPADACATEADRDSRLEVAQDSTIPDASSAKPAAESARESAQAAGENRLSRRRQRRPPAGPRAQYVLQHEVGTGAFGTVFLAEGPNQQKVAVKRVPADSGMEMREVDMLKRTRHPCIVALIDSYNAPGSDGVDSIHVVMEFLPSTLHQQIGGKPLPTSDFKCYSFQLLRALAHLDGLHICHRDLKPENVLVDGQALKLADFGSAKELGRGPSTGYICSRWWRAPELVLGSNDYTTAVDWWSCGCCIAEMMLGEPLFKGDSCWGQMFQIIGALGTPSLDEVHALKPGRGCQRLVENVEKLADAHRAPASFAKLLPAYAGQPEALDLAASFLVFSPEARLHPGKALSHAAFADLLTTDAAGDDSRSDQSLCRVLFSGFSDEEMSRCSEEAQTELRRLSRQCERRRPNLPSPGGREDSPPLKRHRAWQAPLEISPTETVGGQGPLPALVELAAKRPTPGQKCITRDVSMRSSASMDVDLEADDV